MTAERKSTTVKTCARKSALQKKRTSRKRQCSRTIFSNSLIQPEIYWSRTNNSDRPQTHAIK